MMTSTISPKVIHTMTEIDFAQGTSMTTTSLGQFLQKFSDEI
jgi:hypothetical protein